MHRTVKIRAHEIVWALKIVSAYEDQSASEPNFREI